MSLRRTGGFVLCLMVLFAIGCGQGSDTATDDTVTATPDDVVDPPPYMGEVVINDMGMAIDQWGSDDYEIKTGDDTPVIADDTLTLTVSYGGGCETHDFTLVASDVFMESYPVQLLSLIHI